MFSRTVCSFSTRCALSAQATDRNPRFGPPSVALTVAGRVFRLIGRSYTVTGVDFDRQGGGAGRTNAPDRGGPQRCRLWPYRDHH